MNLFFIMIFFNYLNTQSIFQISKKIFQIF